MTIVEKVYKISNTVFLTTLVIFIMAIFANWDFTEKAIRDSMGNMANFQYIGNLMMAIIILLKAIDVYDFALVIVSGATTLTTYFLK